jgi:dienelactone hydrolase
LKRHPMVDAVRVAAVGNSKGGELALLLGATYPQDVKAVVGYAPSAVVWEGIGFDREMYHGGPRSPGPSAERLYRSSRWRGPGPPRLSG